MFFLLDPTNRGGTIIVYHLTSRYTLFDVDYFYGKFPQRYPQPVSNEQAVITACSFLVHSFLFPGFQERRGYFLFAI